MSSAIPAEPDDGRSIRNKHHRSGGISMGDVGDANIPAPRSRAAVDSRLKSLDAPPIEGDMIAMCAGEAGEMQNSMGWKFAHFTLSRWRFVARDWLHHGETNALAYSRDSLGTSQEVLGRFDRVRRPPSRVSRL
nr:hypothetical protein CFP56_13087 [Quercus suber]